MAHPASAGASMSKWRANVGAAVAGADVGQVTSTGSVWLAATSTLTLPSTTGTVLVPMRTRASAPVTVSVSVVPPAAATWVTAKPAGSGAGVVVVGVRTAAGRPAGGGGPAGAAGAGGPAGVAGPAGGGGAGTVTGPGGRGGLALDVVGAPVTGGRGPAGVPATGGRGEAGVAGAAGVAGVAGVAGTVGVAGVVAPGGPPVVTGGDFGWPGESVGVNQVPRRWSVNSLSAHLFLGLLVGLVGEARDLDGDGAGGPEELQGGFEAGLQEHVLALECDAEPVVDRLEVGDDLDVERRPQG